MVVIWSDAMWFVLSYLRPYMQKHPEYMEMGSDLCFLF